MLDRHGLDTAISITEESLTGKLYYSKRQWKESRDKGRDRTFAKLPDGRIVEYTELIPCTELAEDPFAQYGLYDDADFVGEGAFHHFTDERGRKY